MDSQFLFHILRREVPLPPGAATLFQLCYQLLHRHQLFILAVFLHIQNRIAAVTILGQKQAVPRQHPAEPHHFSLKELFAYIRDDVDAFQEEWLQCRRTDQERSIRDDKKKVEQAKKRLSDLDVIISRLYEDYVLGNLSQDRYKKMSADYEAEQERLKLEIEVIEEWVEQREEMNDGLDAFIVLTQKYVDVEELTQTIVNEYIKKIVVYAPDKSSGKRTQKVKIYFNFVDDVDIPIISEPITTETTYGPRKTA